MDLQLLAQRCFLELSADEEERLSKESADVLRLMETLDRLPKSTAAAKPTQPMLRADEVREGLSQEAALQNAQEREDGRIIGPRTL